MSQPDLTRDLEPLACPICGVRLFHVKSLAQSFQPPRTYHEWHHVEDNGCWLRERIGQVVLTATDDEAEQSETIAAWNRRALSEPAAPAGAEVVALEWHLSDDSERWVAARPFGEYIIVRDHRASAETTHGWFNAGRWDWFGSLAEAKAAAQAHFDAAIRSALATSQPVEPPDDSLNDIAAGNEAARDDEWGEAGGDNPGKPHKSLIENMAYVTVFKGKIKEN